MILFLALLMIVYFARICFRLLIFFTITVLNLALLFFQLKGFMIFWKKLERFIIMTIFLILLAVALWQLIRQIRNASHVTDEHIIPFSGGVGSGKTFMATRCLIRRYGSLMLKYRLGKIPFLKKFGTDTKPTIWSSIPMRIGKGRRAFYSNVMTADYWTMRKKLPENALVLADEFGQIASQYEYNNPNVQVSVQTLVRFFRHFTNGYLYITDQSCENITVQVRRRFNVVYNVSDFHRWHLFGLIPMPFYKVYVSKLQVSEDNINNANVLHNENNDLGQDYFFGYLPFRRRKTQIYESRCYRFAYVYGFVNDRGDSWNNLYTRFLADISCTPEERKEFKSNKALLPMGVADPIPAYSVPAPEPKLGRVFRCWDNARKKYNIAVRRDDINE